MASVDDTDAFMAAVRSRFGSEPRSTTSGITTRPAAPPEETKDIKETGQTTSSPGDGKAIRAFLPKRL